MIHVRVWTQDESDSAFLTTFENVDIPLDFRIDDVQDIAKTKSTVSKTFRVPADEVNTSLFGPLFEITADSDFNPRKKAKALITDDTISISEGHIRLLKIINEGASGSERGEFELQFFGEAANLFVSMGEKMLSDYDLSAYDHNLDAADIQDGLSDSGLHSGVIKYGLIDFGIGLTYGGGGTADISDSLGLPFFLLKPWIQAKAILDAIFEEEGFTYESTFLTSDDDFLKQFVLLHRGGQVMTINPDSSAWCKVGINGDQSVTANQESIIELDDDSSFDFDDTNGVFDTSSNVWSYVAPYDGFQWFTAIFYGFQSGYSFRISIEIDSPSDQNGELWVGLFGLFEFDILSGQHVYTFITDEFTSMDQGDLTNVRLWTESANVTVKATANTFFEVVGAPINWNESTFVVNDNTPTNVRAADFLRSILLKFKCVFIPDKDNPTNIKIEPFKDWKDGGDTIDWTQKLDMDKARVIEPLSDAEKKQIILRDKESEDILSQVTKESAGRIYGRKLLINNESDFATGNEVIETEIQTTPLNPIPGTDILIPKLFTSDGDPVEQGLRMCYNGGNIDCNPWYFRDSTDTGYQVTNYNYFGHYENPFPALNDKDFNFGADVPFHLAPEYPINTAYHVYWRDFIEELYSDNSRKLTAYFSLTPVDILNVAFNDKILIKDAYFRLHRIPSYQATKEQSTKVVLLRLPSPDILQFCDLEPDAVGAGGQVTFTDGTTGGQTGSSTCCQAYGYDWIDGACYVAGGNGGNGGAGIQGSYRNGITPNGRSVIRANDPMIGRAVRGFLAGGQNSRVLENNAFAIGAGKNKQFTAFQLENLCDFTTGLAADKRIYLDEANQRNIRIPNGTAWLLDIDIILIENAGAPGIKYSSLKYEALIHKRNDTAAVESGYTATVQKDGYRTTFALTIDVATNTEEHIFVLADGGVTAGNVRVVAVVKGIELKTDSLV